LEFSVTTFEEVNWNNGELFIFPIDSNLKLSKNLKAFQSKIDIKIKDVLKNSKFKSNFGQTILIRTAKLSFLLFGTGKSLNPNYESEKLGGTLYSSINKSGFKNITIFEIGNLPSSKQEKIFSKILIGMKMRSYSFLKYKTKSNDNEQLNIESVKIVTKKGNYLENQLKINKALYSGISMARDLISEPANILTPDRFIKIINELTKIGIEIDVLDEEKMNSLGMNALLGVGKGSKQKSYLAVMKWNGNKKSKKKIAFVGKGVCFDSGGLSLKSSKGMEDMKWDMGGAGIVVGAMKAIALQKIKKNIVGVVGLVENMPDANAQRPGDIVKSMSGKTIEVLNTDAEGRLVLADALYYTNKTYEPEAIIDLATLTGAIITALGNERAGLFSNNEKLSKKLHEDRWMQQADSDIERRGTEGVFHRYCVDKGYKDGCSSGCWEHAEDAIADGHLDGSLWGRRIGLAKAYCGAKHESVQSQGKLITEKKKKKKKTGKCPESGCITKRGKSWRIISNRTGKLWKAKYDSKKDAEDGLDAYHANK